MSIEFIELYKEVAGHTVITPDRLWFLWTIPRLALESGVVGEFAEVGTFQGGSAKLIYRSVHGQRPMHVFDTFSGIPEDEMSMKDAGVSAGDFTSTLEDVANYLKPCRNMMIYPGRFPRETSEPIEKRRFAFVHLDMDIYKPTLEALQFFYTRMSPGGAFILDDYKSLPGIEAAIQDFMRDHKVDLVPTTQMQCLLRLPQVEESWDISRVII